MKAHMHRVISALICLGLLASCERAEPPEPPQKLPGPQLVLDPDFGDGGEVTTNLGRNEGVRALVLQEDGKIVAVGLSGGQGMDDSGFALVRYLPDGSLDAAFGENGIVSMPTGSPATSPNQGNLNTAGIQADGKILVAGFMALSVDEHYIPAMALVRYNPDGSLDTSFGENGFVTALKQEVGEVTALELQADGKIVVAGEGVYDSIPLARYTAEGQLDSSFGTGGIVYLPFELSEEGNPKPSLLQTEEGLLVDVDTRLVRLNDDGTLDTTFGDKGEIATGYTVQALAAQPDGAIIVAQFAETHQGELSITSDIPPSPDFRLLRYTSAGELDTRFGQRGAVVTDTNSYDEVLNLTLQKDGRIIAAGKTGDAVAVVRYTLSGEVDASFVGAFGGAYALGLDDQNRIVVGGARRGGDAYDFALARFLP